MDEGWLTVHTRGVIKDRASGQETRLEGTYKFSEDVTYLATAKFLVETGRLLLEKPAGGGGVAGVTTPAVALGSQIVQRLESETGAKLEIKEAITVRSSL